MRILLTKISDRHHAVEIARADGSRDAIELVTREALFHDFPRCRSCSSPCLHVDDP